MEKLLTKAIYRHGSKRNEFRREIQFATVLEARGPIALMKDSKSNENKGYKRKRLLLRDRQKIDDRRGGFSPQKKNIIHNEVCYCEITY